MVTLTPPVGVEILVSPRLVTGIAEYQPSNSMFRVQLARRIYLTVDDTLRVWDGIFIADMDIIIARD
jgi:hypothetical protein